MAFGEQVIHFFSIGIVILIEKKLQKKTANKGELSVLVYNYDYFVTVRDCREVWYRDA